MGLVPIQVPERLIELGKDSISHRREISRVVNLPSGFAANLADNM
jgi:hypothetical protein